MGKSLLLFNTLWLIYPLKIVRLDTTAWHYKILGISKNKVQVDAT